MYYKREEGEAAEEDKKGMTKAYRSGGTW